MTIARHDGERETLQVEGGKEIEVECIAEGVCKCGVTIRLIRTLSDGEMFGMHGLPPCPDSTELTQVYLDQLNRIARH